MKNPNVSLADPPALPPLAPHALDLGEGAAVAVRVPAPDALPPIEDWPIDPAERAAAAKWGARRQNTWIAGRVALRAAAARLGFACGPILPDDRRAPILPAGLCGSLTHTSEWAVAWLAPADGRTRGIDLEDPARPVLPLTPTLLTAAEQAALAALPAEAQNGELIRRFALKEAIYKAIDPKYRRYVDFLEVEVWPGADETAAVVWRLAKDEAPPAAITLRALRWGSAGWLCTAVAEW
ncbi:MAG: 4'-phosphopantetheinyl transferase superfamily protein [Myxococcales bacterium]|nr:4'-phosphopantetheinyl transferase superfamily protein [Myxococcales bacterium]